MGTCVRVPALTQRLGLVLKVVVRRQMLTTHHVSAVGVESMTCVSTHRPAKSIERLDEMRAEMSQGGSDGFQLKHRTSYPLANSDAVPCSNCRIRTANNKRTRDRIALISHREFARRIPPA